MEYKIGEVIETPFGKAIVKEDKFETGCNGCIITGECENFMCSQNERSDKKSVIFESYQLSLGEIDYKIKFYQKRFIEEFNTCKKELLKNLLEICPKCGATDLILDNYQIFSNNGKHYQYLNNKWYYNG